MRGASIFLALMTAAGVAGAQASPRIVDGGMPDSLTGRPGDVAKGRAILADRQVGLCLLCHTGPFPEVRFQGNLAPDLTGVGDRYTVAQLRLRLVDPARLNADTIMPAYLRTDGLARVAAPFRDKPILTAEQIEDVVAFLATLRTETEK